MTTKTIITGAAETMLSLQMLPTMDSDVHTSIPTSSAPRRAVPSLWTAWEIGKSMVSASMMRMPTRTRSAALLLWREPLHIMAMPVHMLIAMFSAARYYVPSLWTVLVLGTSTALVLTTRKHTATSVADCTRSQLLLRTTDMLAHMPTSLSSAPLRSVPSLWTVLVLGACMTLATTKKLITRTSAADCTLLLSLP